MPTSGGRTRGLASEDGFTLFELLIAMAVTAIGLMALVSSFDHSRELVSTAEKTEVASHQAERSMERVLAMPYAQVAHATAPVHDTDSTNPAHYVSGSSYQWDQGATGPRSDTLEVDSVNGQIANVSNWADSTSRLTGKTYTFVTRTGDLCSATGCPAGDQRGRRVTLAVTVDGPRPLRKPVLISSLIINPAATGG
ncbi:MAG TPA: prepilin-type N-terminal cleavage/methylation domain-containing protein [Thermoleophilaceae bacterium]|nr:prepilin-type N-terminal cleavage/methylation domain-containing protein [Thermoleophilaceae bacterium]